MIEQARASHEPAGQTVAALPEDFRFSQTNLQVFDDCKRRFWLSYMQQIPWPAVQASPIAEHERVVRLGQIFHRLVERAETGVEPDMPPGELEAPLSDWFHAYQHYRPQDLPTQYVEIERALDIPLARAGISTRLTARYDLIAAADQSRAVIVDWKTGRKRADPASLQRRMQTAVYLYVLVEASARLPWGPVQPEQVEMRYWFVAAPEHPIIFRYDTLQHEANRRRILGIVDEILAGRRAADFPKVVDTAFSRKYLCGFCTYRGLCDRGEHASDIDELDDELEGEMADERKGIEPQEVIAVFETGDFGLADVEELTF